MLLRSLSAHPSSPRPRAFRPSPSSRLFRWTGTCAGIVFALCLLAPPAWALGPRHGERLDRGALAAATASLPLLFEENRGQTDARVRFVARANDALIFFTDSEVVWSVAPECGNVPAVPSPLPHLPPSCEEGPWSVHMSFSKREGAALVGEEPLAAKGHYLAGPSTSNRLTSVATWGRLRQLQIWPGIDAVFHGRRDRFEFDFLVQPGADPGSIRLGFTGGELFVDDRRDLIVRLATRVLVQRPPILYQEIDGRRVDVAGDWKILAPGVAGFEIGPYDAARPLVIDPVVLFSTHLGGSADDQIRDVALDRSGHVYLTGFSRSLDFPVRAGLQPTYSGGSYEAFVTKLSPDGTDVVYSTYIGGSGADVGTGIALDGTDVVLAFTTSSPDLPTSSLIQPTYGGGIFDAAVAKIVDDGGRLDFLTYLGGRGHDFSSVVAVDRGTILVTGGSASADYPLVAPVQGTNAGDFDAVLSRIDPTSDRLLFSTYFGGSGLDQAFALAVDDDGRAIIGGATGSVDLPTLHPLQSTFAGLLDGFLAVFSPQGLWSSTYFGGSGYDMIADVVFSENTLFTGWTNSPDFPTRSPLQPQLAGGLDAFVARVSGSGPTTQLGFSTFLGTSQEDLGLALDASEHALFVAGLTSSPAFPLESPTQSVYGGGSHDVFLAQMKKRRHGYSLRFSTFVGGSGDEQITHGIAVGCLDSVVVGGWTSSADLVTTPVAWQPALLGGSDGFVQRIATTTAEKGLRRTITRVEELARHGLIRNGDRGHLLAKLRDAARNLHKDRPQKARDTLQRLYEELVTHAPSLQFLSSEVRDELSCAIGEILQQI